jgi:hypothetical protein
MTTELIQQRLRLLQDRRVEAFGEPSVDRGEEIVGFGALALVAPQAGEAGGGVQLKNLCALPLGDGNGSLIVFLRSGLIACGAQQVAVDSLHLRFGKSLLGGVDDAGGLREAKEALIRLAGPGSRLGKHQKQRRRRQNRARGPVHRQPLGDQADGFRLSLNRGQ